MKTPELWNSDALLFDLDGVVTRTATIHAAAWKQLFDEFLRRRTREHGIAYAPFEIGTDYVRHVDGRRRYDGVDAFLRSRGIELPRARRPTLRATQPYAPLATPRTVTSRSSSDAIPSRCSTTPWR